MGEMKIVAKCRTVVTFDVSCCKSVNSHSDSGVRGREMQNSRRFGTCLGSSRLKSVNSQGSGALLRQHLQDQENAAHGRDYAVL